VDHEAKTVRVQSPSERPRGPSILVAAIAAFFLIALLKPWSFGENGSDDGRPGTQRAIPSDSGLGINGEPSPAATPSIPDPNAMACLTDAMEQVVILERWAGNEVRSWVATPDVTVSGPLDARLVPISIFSSHVIGLGICAPRAPLGTQQPAARLLDVQLIVRTAGGPLAVDLGTPDPITRQLGGPEPAVLYGAPLAILPRASVGPPRFEPPGDPGATDPPPETQASGTALPSPTDGWATWPTGSYAIGFLFPSDASRAVRWLRIDLIRAAGASS
jgi:hypothetical protein